MEEVRQVVDILQNIFYAYIVALFIFAGGGLVIAKMFMKKISEGVMLIRIIEGRQAEIIRNTSPIKKIDSKIKDLP